MVSYVRACGIACSVHVVNEPGVCEYLKKVLSSVGLDEKTIKRYVERRTQSSFEWNCNGKYHGLAVGIYESGHLPPFF